MTPKKASVKALLKEKVILNVHQKSLAEALYQLSDQTGASIVLDPRAGEALLSPVSATFANDAWLEGALTVLTDMAGLRFTVVAGTIYVTTPENANKLEKSLKK